VCLGLDQELADPAEQRFRRLGVHLASLAGASLASGGVSSPPAPRNGAWGALCGVRPVGCGTTLPAVDTGCLPRVLLSLASCRLPGRRLSAGRDNSGRGARPREP